MQTIKYKNGFTLIELIVVICIIGVLSAIILFSVVQYINRGKDSNVIGHLSTLITSGEVYYNKGNSYEGFCQYAFDNVFPQMPPGASPDCGENTADSYQSWVACAKKFANSANVWCVDSRGMEKEIVGGDCDTITGAGRCGNAGTCKCP